MIVHSRRLWLASVVLGLCACAAAPVAERHELPMLRLSPALLTESASLQQRLRVTRLDDGRVAAQSIDVQLQLEPGGLLLAAFALGQRVLLLQWDGQDLQEQRHAMLPASVDAAHLLRDMSLVYWPAASVQQALPQGWSFIETEAGRELRHDGQLAVSIRIDGPLLGRSQVQLRNLQEHYALQIESAPQEGAP
ncbi:DUF3261 domain-containing protein [Ideonella azotifigens]|uniref:DUF3261 domain-containing protein n=1 Tax=Ideonella azotifigens TaxID=513160 RepID=A0ABP3VMX9_9BURK|nr:DUF3261 domain-containing protein [Ideonella azotifigens]MCD2338798.1 DUF3261 domain-containing protein [Ideonella azotifigens]